MMAMAWIAVQADLPLVVETVTAVLFFVGTTAAVYLGYRPARELVLRQEEQYDRILRGALLLDIQPRLATLATGALMVAMGLLGFMFTASFFGFVAGMAVAAVTPAVLLRVLRQRRLAKLEDQLVGGITTLVSGVRAGLNLVQAMELVARDGAVPLCQEFAHLLREYEYGVPLDEAMSNAGARIGSGDFRLLFSALQTHRERGGDLGQTLDRIAESIREIQRLEKRAQTLTAQGRATARWLGAMPVVIGAIYYMIDSSAVRSLFEQSSGNLILVGIVVMNICGFLWIKKIVAIDI